MKKKIAILGSTGSIGKSLLKIISRDKDNFDVVLLSANQNYKELLKQAKKFDVKKLIIKDKKFNDFLKSKMKKKIKIYNTFENFEEIFPNKIDYVMSSIVGLDGLVPTINIIKHTKKIAIANKESIICAWNLIKQKLNKHNTEFIPVDSEHFSIWYALKNNENTSVSKVFLTASGGPLLNVPKNKFKTLKLNQVLKHPNWNMGSKITIDSSTIMNKVFEIIEAKKIFKLNYKQLDIIIHPQSYIHAIVKFSNGMIKIIAHDTTMEIPIFNSLYSDQIKNLKSNKVEINKLNKLSFSKIDDKKFPSIKILNILPKNDSLFETALVSANDELVKLFLVKKISYTDLNIKLMKLLHSQKVKKLKKKLPTNISEVINTSKYIKSKINSLN